MRFSVRYKNFCRLYGNGAGADRLVRSFSFCLSLPRLLLLPPHWSSDAYICTRAHNVACALKPYSKGIKKKKYTCIVCTYKMKEKWTKRSRKIRSICFLWFGSNACVSVCVSVSVCVCEFDFLKKKKVMCVVCMRLYVCIRMHWAKFLLRCVGCARATANASQPNRNRTVQFRFGFWIHNRSQPKVSVFVYFVVCCLSVESGRANHLRNVKAFLLFFMVKQRKKTSEKNTIWTNNKEFKTVFSWVRNQENKTQISVTLVSREKKGETEREGEREKASRNWTKKKTCSK